ncbi:hypothetical protein L7F22_009788 [Adiantum nelumboides]|nr:hypothetical protein [Adiantum nelumboides]
MVEKEKDLKVKSIRSDRGGEFLSENFARWCKSEGIRRQLTTPYTPSQNGVVVRKNRTIIPILPPTSLSDPPASPVITPSTSHPVPPIEPPDVSPDHALSDSDSDLDVADATPEVDLAPPRQEKRILGWLYSTSDPNFSAASMASGEGQSNPSTSGDAGGDHNEDYGNEYGPPFPTQEELRKMEHRRLVGEATNMMLNFAKDPNLAKYMTETTFQDMHAQWKATTTSLPKPDDKKQYSEKELEEEVEARLAQIFDAHKKG